MDDLTESQRPAARQKNGRLASRPFSVPFLPVQQVAMRAAGVAVREPRGVAAVPKRLAQWSSGDVPDERIGDDIPLAALGSLQWRP